MELQHCIEQIFFKKKKRKKPWIFYCDKCHERISTDTHKFFFRLMIFTNDTEGFMSKYCSNECAESEVENRLEFAKKYVQQGCPSVLVMER
jgi:hypothetical protein